MLAIALVVLSGILVLWFWPGERASGRSNAPGPQKYMDSAKMAQDLAAPAPLAAEPAPTRVTGTELEPFAATRTNPVPDGAKGSLRGHVEVSGEQDFPASWRLLLRPSTTMPQRERAESRTLEFTDGRKDFEVAELPLGGYDVSAQATGFNGQILPLLLEPGSEHPFVNLRLVPCGELEGRVLDAQGLAAEGVTISLLPVADPTPLEAVSGADGVFRFPQLSDGAYELLVGKTTAPLMPEHHPVRFQAPHLTFPDLTLPLLGELHVRVVDSLERPLEGVEVTGSGTNGGVFVGKTDYDGRLVAKHLPSGRFRLRLSHPALDEKYARRVAVDVVAGEVAQAPVRLGP
ncbi:MAG: carboxypeptidase regulatory-like domain-containing protein [Planctomycetes bacterium]|nr:carboxypeptidase regulatory-like domain-containing protein [Planctomycetota bacterium]